MRAAFDGNGEFAFLRLFSSILIYSFGTAPILDRDTAPSFVDPMKSAGDARSDG